MNNPNGMLGEQNYLDKIRSFLVGRKIEAVDSPHQGAPITITLSNGKRVHIQGQFTMQFENQHSPDIVDVEARMVP
jgi:hypothetical protein